VEQRRTGTGLSRDEDRSDDLLAGERIPLPVVEELQTRREQPVDGRRRGGLRLGVEAALVDRVDHELHPFGECVVAEVDEPGLRGRVFDERVRVHHRSPPTSRSTSSSVSRTFCADRAANRCPAMPL
jgi:hypothetical protein